MLLPLRISSVGTYAGILMQLKNVIRQRQSLLCNVSGMCYHMKSIY